ncbi:MAG: sulfatase, partial [Calditrichaeota bacterium]|nr:sulfatase [Calditrichota bacterium]
MTDDHGYQAISAYGSMINRTPNIDRLAAGGMRFERSFCTNSICAPSRAVLLTGQYSHRNGQINNAVVFDSTQQTFPKLLQQAGYQTVLVGKWHLKSRPTGFDYWNILPGQGRYYNPDFIEMGERKRLEGYATDLTTDIALTWLDGRDQSKPFCLLLHHKAPHRNWMPGPEQLNLFADEEIPLPETYFDDYAGRLAAQAQEMRIDRHTFLSYDLKLPWSLNTNADSLQRDSAFAQSEFNRMTPEQKAAWDAVYQPRNEAFQQAGYRGADLAKAKYQRYIKDYLRCVASVDDNIGRVLDYLERSGLSENTIVVYTSDQGFYLGEHGWFDKRFMYEQSLRLPLIVRYPREIRAEVNERDMVLNLDFAPTFLDFAGVAIPEEMQGRSLRPLLTGNTPADWRQSIYYHYYEYPSWHMVKKHYGVRSDRYKLIHFYDDIDTWELFDLQNDPDELRNLYDDPQYADVIAE